MKEALTSDGMISLLKQRARGEAVLELLLNDGKSTEEAMATVVGVQVMTPDGIENRDYRVSELLEEARALDAYQAHCEQCLAGRGEAFGCLKSIHYPLSAKAEWWLAREAEQAYKKGLPCSMVFQYIQDLQITGDQFQAMRADAGGVFLELKKPLEVAVSRGFDGKKKVNTDQLLQTLLGFPRVQNPHQMIMLLSFVDALNIADTRPAEGSCEMTVRFALNGGKESWRSFNLPPDPSDDSSITELKEYFRTMFVAYVLDREIIVDL